MADDGDLEKTRRRGESLWEDPDNRVGQYMREKRRFPHPIIILDNRAGDLASIPDNPRFSVPECFILVEGHKRFEIAIHMLDLGDLPEVVDVWLMQRV